MMLESIIACGICFSSYIDLIKLGFLAVNWKSHREVLRVD